MTTTNPTAPVQDPNAFLMGGGAKSFKFGDTPGTTVRGRIDDLQMRQQREPKDNSLKWWKDGNPMMELRVILETDLRDADDPNDDGRRAIYVRGEMQKAVRDAIKAAGRSNIEAGGILSVRFEAWGPKPQNSAMSPPKLYRAKYEPPTTSVSTEDF